MCLEQEGAISTIAKLSDILTYLGYNILSAESDINIDLL